MERECLLLAKSEVMRTRKDIGFGLKAEVTGVDAEIFSGSKFDHPSLASNVRF
jgi:hypothetical protein